MNEETLNIKTQFVKKITLSASRTRVKCVEYKGVQMGFTKHANTVYTSLWYTHSGLEISLKIPTNYEVILIY